MISRVSGIRACSRRCNWQARACISATRALLSLCCHSSCTPAKDSLPSLLYDTQPRSSPIFFCPSLKHPNLTKLSGRLSGTDSERERLNYLTDRLLNRIISISFVLPFRILSFSLTFWLIELSRYDSVWVNFELRCRCPHSVLLLAAIYVINERKLCIRRKLKRPSSQSNM